MRVAPGFAEFPWMSRRPAARGREAARVKVLLFTLAFVAGASSLARADAAPIGLSVDTREVTRGVIHVHETIPGVSGRVKLVYPKWIPGTHGPTGPVSEVASITVSSGGEALAWRRDPVDLYAIYVDVPAGKSGLEVSFDDYNAGADGGRLATPNIMSLSWNRVVLTPYVENYSTQIIAPSLTLPGSDWQWATALESTGQSGATVSFKPVSLEQLVDSPIDAGLNVKKIPLGAISGAPVDIAIFADTQDQLEISDKHVENLRRLVREMAALYGARHFNHYTFLLTVSDVLPGQGLEHHQSSDDGSSGDSLTSDKGFAGSLGDLLGHEFNHSWDGKYRRPADLATPNLQVPMVDDLLWVYEGMTQHYGQLQVERSGAWTQAQWLDVLVGEYASLDTTTGRATRPLVDTATAASVLRGSRAFAAARRTQDYYTEGALLWLEADVTIRKLSGGKRSLDDFTRAFFGQHDTGPIVVTYTRQDVVDGLNAVQPYDWAGFFHTRLDAVAPHPPNPFEAGGYRVVYQAEPSAFSRLGRYAGGLDARYSLGFSASAQGVVGDVLDGSPAAKAGLGPGMKLIGIDGRTLTDGQSQLDSALKAAQSGGKVRLLLTAGNTYREVSIDYHGGPRFPHLERIPNTPDVLKDIAAPRAPAAT